jgi:Spy/CpxP family protein refolding chaperone
MPHKTMRSISTLVAGVALTLGGIGVAQASNGADDPPGHEHHGGKHHHHGAHHGT